MPHFTLQIVSNRPILNAVVGVSEARRAALEAAGQPVPGGIPIRALLDTGASASCLDPSVLGQLGLTTPTGSTLVHTPTTGSTPVSADVFDIGLLIPGAEPSHVPLVLPTVPVTRHDFSAQGFLALIGRDILCQCVLVYNGSMGFFTLAF